MRISFLLAAFGAIAASAAAEASGPRQGRDQDAAFEARQQGQILPLAAIRARVRMPGANFIGAELADGGTIYRLKFMRGPDVIWVDVDARTGRILGRSGH